MATHVITSKCNSGGTITPLGLTTVTDGQSQQYTITPATGYVTSAIYVDNVSVTVATTYTFSSNAANHDIVAVFTPTGGYYCNQDDLTAMIGTKQLTDLSNDTANSTVPNPTNVMAMIEKACAYIDSELGGLYTVPFSPVPSLIKSIAVTLSIYFLFMRRFSAMEIPKGWIDEHENVIRQIAALSSLEQRLDPTLYPVQSPASVMQQAQAGERAIDFSTDSALGSF